MMETLKITALILITWLAIISLTLTVKSYGVPPIPMTIDGYVIIQKIDGTNITAPSGLHVYAKEGVKIINTDDPEAKYVTNGTGYYLLGASPSADNIPIDLWVENINVTRIIFHQGGFLTLNLTTIDNIPPTIQILTPQPEETVAPNQPLWINTTLTDNLAINETTITMMLNETSLTPTYDHTSGLLYFQTKPLTEGLYIVNLSARDLAGNPATETWNFTAYTPTPPAISIINPTTENPICMQSGLSVDVTLTYTEPYPLNGTITIYNSTTTIAESSTTTLAPGTTNITVPVDIPSWASEGKYNINATMFNTYNLSSTVTQENAIIIDNTPPTIEITYPTENALLSVSTLWINGTVIEANKGEVKPVISDSERFSLIWNSVTGEFSFKNKTAIPDGTLTITVSFTDPAQNTASTTVTFTLDTTPPVISNPYQNPPGQIIQPNTIVNVDVGTNVTITTNVTDPNGIETVTLTYKINETQWTNIPMTPTTENEYTATIPSSNLPINTNVTYYITATDKAGNTAKTPTNEIYFQYNIIPEFTTITMLIMLLITTILAMIMRKKRKL